MGILYKEKNPNLSFAKSWRSDLMAAISVSLVALPLGLGVAVASGVPPIAGVTSAIVGGLFTSFVRSSHIAINGPTAGLIAIVLSAMTALDDGSGRTYNYILAAFVCAGLLQVILGFFRWGKIAEVFPTTVINGILAAIGVIIIAKQIPFAIGVEVSGEHTVELLQNDLKAIPYANPILALITLVGLVLLVFHSRISYKLFHVFPAPIWVLLFAIPVAYYFGFSKEHSAHFLGRSVDVGPYFLISVPDNILESLLLPDFSMIAKPAFWLTVFSVSLIATIETLAAAKAIDRLDPYKRKTDLNKDLVAVGASTILSAFLGGLPVISVIVRTTVNIQNGAKTSWSNFFHGLLLLLFVLALTPVLQMIPLAALAAILIFMGFKLASPRLFRETYSQGLEQLLFLSVTLIFTLYNNLLVGILAGMACTLLVHILLARLPLTNFVQLQFFSKNKIVNIPDGRTEYRIRGVANFLRAMKINDELRKIPRAQDIVFDVSKANILDLTISEYLYNFKSEYEKEFNASVLFRGLDAHTSSTTNKLALKSLKSLPPAPLNQRQKKLYRMAMENGWEYQQQMEYNVSNLSKFKFFESRPIEYKENIIRGKCKKSDVKWELADITFDEGALTAKEVYHTTVEMLHLEEEIPVFILESETFLDRYFDRVLGFSGQKDIDIQRYPDFSDKFILKGSNEESILRFFNSSIIHFLDDHEVYHIESNGNSLLIFRNLRIAKTEDIKTMMEFSEDFVFEIEKTKKED